MHKNTKSNLHHITSEAAAIAISSLKYNLNDYSGYKEIRNTFIENNNLDNKILTDSLNIEQLDNNEIFFINDFEIGYVDFYKIAFYLFDYKISSLVFLYLIIFISTILLYTYEFRSNNTALTILIFFLVSYYYILITVVNTPNEFGVIYNYRIMTMLGVVPLLHLTFFSVFSENKINLFSLLRIIIQSIFLAWLYHIRITSQWMFIFLILIFFLICYLSHKEKLNNFKNTIFLIIKKTIPLFIVFLMTINFSLFYNKNKNDLYNQKLGKHVFWHSIFLGIITYDDKAFELNTKLDKKKLYPWNDIKYFCNKSNYTFERPVKSSLRNVLCHENLFTNQVLKFYLNSKYFFTKYPRDQYAYSSVIIKLYSENNDEFEIFNFKPEEKVDYFSEFWIFKLNNQLKQKYKDIDKFNHKNNYEYRRFSWSEDFNWVDYEKKLKEITLNYISENPLKFIYLNVFIKPLYLLKNFLVYYTGNLVSLLILVIAIINAKNNSGFVNSTKNKIYFKIILILLLSSSIPPLVTYSDVISICDSSLIFWIFILFLTTIFFTKKTN